MKRAISLILCLVVGLATFAGSGYSPTFVYTLTVGSITSTGQIKTSANGAASTPIIYGYGTWYASGTATTTKPYLLIEPSGATSTAWNTAGTGLGVNAATTFMGNLADFQIDGLSYFKVDYLGRCIGKVFQGTTTYPATLQAQQPVVADASQDGNAAQLLASAAQAGLVTAGAANGGNILITAGSAARLTSGDGNGGDVYLNTGAGVGSGTRGIIRAKGNLQLGLNTLDGKLIWYSEQGTTDYSASLNPNATMTSNADFYLPADEPIGESFLTMGTDGIFDYTLVSTIPTLAAANTFSNNQIISKADSGGVTDLLINPAAKASGNLVEAQINGAPRFYVNYSGSVFVKNYLSLDTGIIEEATSGTALTLNGYQSTFTGAGPSLKFQTSVLSGTTASTGIAMQGTNTKTANAHTFASISPTYDQASSTASNTDLLVNRTETSLGSGSQYLVDLQVGGVSQWNVTNKGIQTTGIVADAALQYGTILMADAGTDKRFDVNGAGGTLPIGVLAGTGASAQGTMQGVVFNGLGRILMDEDVAVTRGHVIFQDAGTAGRGDDNAALQAAGLNVGKALTSEAVSAVINPTGCTGGAGCINTALNTPNTGPAGQITLGVDVAALGWAPGEPVVYYNSGGTTPTGLTDGNVYWLLSVSTTKVTIAATRGGAVVVPSTQGNDGTQYLQRLPLCVINLQ